MFWEVGATKEGKMALEHPQAQNSYSYAGGNPVTMKDPSGRWYKEFVTGNQSWSSFQLELGAAANQLSQDSSAWRYAIDNPIESGVIITALSLPIVSSIGSGGAAVYMATYPGVSASFAGAHSFAAAVYASLAYEGIREVPGVFETFGNIDPSKKESIYAAAWSLGKQVGPSLVGSKVGAILDAAQFGTMISNGGLNMVTKQSASHQSKSSGSNYKSVSAYGLSGGSTITKQNAGAVASFISQFIKK